jgi:hypothetical protein
VVIDKLPDFPYDATPRRDNCERCGLGPEGDLRFVIVRGRARYFGRTLCDMCAEELLETLLQAEPEGGPVLVGTV